MRARRALFLACATLAMAGLARGTPGVLAPDNQLEPNYRRAAALGLEGMLVRVFADPDSLARFAALPDGPAGRVSRVDEDGRRFWIWREGVDLLVDVDGGARRGDGPAAPDSIDDMLIVDYGADGTPDRIVDWEDLDRDGRPERQMLYAIAGAPLGGDFMSCVVVDQRAPQRGFWFLTHWQYQQEVCQTRCDFSGDGFFALGRYDDRRRRWHSFGENPFGFYDPDGDGLTDEVLLLVGQDAEIRRARWSFDSDHDATPEHPYDYDLSLTLAGPRRAPAEACDSLPLLGGGRLPLVRWDRARAFARDAHWSNALLAVDENDRNLAPEDSATGERWEGVIAEGVLGIDAVGGPGCGVLNKRYEVDRDVSGGLRFYVSPVDLRLHLYGAERGEMRIDLNGDRRQDLILETEDRDGDGFFDAWRQTRADGRVAELAVRQTEAAAAPIPVEWAAVSRADAELRERWSARARHAGLATQAERFAADLERWRTEPVGPAWHP
jgi:hypothetical protein